MTDRSSDGDRPDATDAPGAVEGLSPARDGDRSGSPGDGPQGPRRVAGLFAAGLLAVGVLALAGLGFSLFVVDLGCGCSTVTPQASFDPEYDAANGTLAIQHVDGSVFTEENTAALTIVGTESGTVGRVSTWPVSAGDYLVGGVPVAPGETIRVVHTGPDGERTTTLASYEVPTDAGADDGDGG